jgi:outer membrane murein-binding lipoprotein Lpp
MPYLIVAVVLGFALTAWRINVMSEALTTAINRLTTEVTETLDDVAQVLRDIANNTGDQQAADAINAQADRLDAFQATLPKGTDTQPGNDTQAG